MTPPRHNGPGALAVESHDLPQPDEKGEVGGGVGVEDLVQVETNREVSTGSLR